MAARCGRLLLWAALLAPVAAAGTANSRRPDLLPYDCGRRLVPQPRPQPGYLPPPPPGAGATPAYLGQYPWQARLETYSAAARGYVHHCGGIVIARRHVLTAAHCVTNVTLSSLVVRVGDWKLGGRDGAERAFGVANVNVHPQFDRGTLANNVALLRLKTRDGVVGVEFSRHVQPACLPEVDTEFDAGTVCEVSGWGKTADGAPVSEVLLGSAVPLISDQLCSAPEVHRTRFAAGTMLCAGLIRGGPDTCGGDSGGPLVCRDRDTDRFTAYGLVPAGEPRGCSRLPGLYTRLSGFVAWILDRLQLDFGESLATSVARADCGRSVFSPPEGAGTGLVRDVADFPWLVFFHMALGEGWACTGTIISDRWILTGTNCRPQDMKVQSAVLIQSSNKPSVQINIKRVVQHPAANDEVGLFDFDASYGLSALKALALLETSEPILLSSGLKPICLPGPRQVSAITANQTVVGAGYFSRVDGSGFSPLTWFKRTVIDTARCRLEYMSSRGISERHVPDIFGEGTFCTKSVPRAGRPSPYASFLLHTYGSPLMLEATDNDVKRWYVVGLRSPHFENDENERAPDPHLALNQFVDWIRSVTSIPTN